MANPKVAMRAELEAKYRRKYEEKLLQAKAELQAAFEVRLALAEANFRRQIDIGMQIAADAALMAADDVFDVSVYRAKQFMQAHIDNVNGIAKLTVDDSKDDPDIVFTKTDIDRRLLQIVGVDNFVPWEERYKVEGAE
jgi:hypothetical protein